MRCMRCGSDNPAGAKYCLSCRMEIPFMLPSMEVKPPTPVLIFLRKIRDEIESGIIEPERIRDSYMKVLTHMESQREAFIARFEKLPASLQSQASMDTVTAMGDFMEAVQEMALYIEDGDSGHVRSGMDRAENADIMFQNSLQSDDEIAFSFSQRSVILPPQARK